MIGGFAKIHRSILEWEYYTDLTTFKLFLHLVLKANIKDVRYMGQTVPRGSLVIRERVIGEECGLTYQEVRTALKKLLTTGEITKKSTNKFTVVSLVNYSLYQDEVNGKQRTTNEQSTHHQRTINAPLTHIEEEEKEEKERKKNKKNLKDKESGGEKPPPPTVPEKKKYGNYGWIKLTDAEYQRLVKDHGEGTTATYIDIVDELAQGTGNKNKWKDWNLTVRRAIRDKWGSSYAATASSASMPVKKNRFTNYEQHQRDYEEIDRLEFERLKAELQTKHTGG